MPGRRCVEVRHEAVFLDRRVHWSDTGVCKAVGASEQPRLLLHQPCQDEEMGRELSAYHAYAVADLDLAQTKDPGVLVRRGLSH